MKDKEKQFMLFSERKKLAEEYETWVNQPLKYGKIKDCPLSVITFMQSKGFRKLPKNSVVLTSEEHKILVKTAQGKIGNMKATDFLKACISSGVMVEAVSTEEQVKQAYEKGSKETAEKFANEIKAYIYENDYLIEQINKIAREFGVEIKE